MWEMFFVKDSSRPGDTSSSSSARIATNTITNKSPLNGATVATNKSLFSSSPSKLPASQVSVSTDSTDTTATTTARIMGSTFQGAPESALSVTQSEPSQRTIEKEPTTCIASQQLLNDNASSSIVVDNISSNCIMNGKEMSSSLSSLVTPAAGTVLDGGTSVACMRQQAQAQQPQQQAHLPNIKINTQTMENVTTKKALLKRKSFELKLLVQHANKSSPSSSSLSQTDANEIDTIRRDLINEKTKEINALMNEMQGMKMTMKKAVVAVTPQVKETSNSISIPSAPVRREMGGENVLSSEVSAGAGVLRRDDGSNAKNIQSKQCQRTNGSESSHILEKDPNVILGHSPDKKKFVDQQSPLLHLKHADIDKNDDNNKMLGESIESRDNGVYPHMDKAVTIENRGKVLKLNQKVALKSKSYDEEVTSRDMETEECWNPEFSQDNQQADEMPLNVDSGSHQDEVFANDDESPITKKLVDTRMTHYIDKPKCRYPQQNEEIINDKSDFMETRILQYTEKVSAFDIQTDEGKVPVEQVEVLLDDEVTSSMDKDSVCVQGIDNSVSSVKSTMDQTPIDVLQQTIDLQKHVTRSRVEINLQSGLSSSEHVTADEIYARNGENTKSETAKCYKDSVCEQGYGTTTSKIQYREQVPTEVETVMKLLKNVSQSHVDEINSNSEHVKVGEIDAMNDETKDGCAKNSPQDIRIVNKVADVSKNEESKNLKADDLKLAIRETAHNDPSRVIVIDVCAARDRANKCRSPDDTIKSDKPEQLAITQKRSPTSQSERLSNQYDKIDQMKKKLIYVDFQSKTDQKRPTSKHTSNQSDKQSRSTKEDLDLAIQDFFGKKPLENPHKIKKVSSPPITNKSSSRRTKKDETSSEMVAKLNEPPLPPMTIRRSSRRPKKVEIYSDIEAQVEEPSIPPMTIRRSSRRLKEVERKSTSLTRLPPKQGKSEPYKAASGSKSFETKKCRQKGSVNVSLDTEIQKCFLPQQRLASGKKSRQCVKEDRSCAKHEERWIQDFDSDDESVVEVYSRKRKKSRSKNPSKYMRGLDSDDESDEVPSIQRNRSSGKIASQWMEDRASDDEADEVSSIQRRRSSGKIASRWMEDRASDDESEISSRSRQRRYQRKVIEIGDLDSDYGSDKVFSSRQRRSSGKKRTKWAKMDSDDESEVSSRSRQRRSSVEQQMKAIEIEDLESDDESDEVFNSRQRRWSSGKNRTKWAKREDLDSDDESEIYRSRQMRSINNYQSKSVELEDLDSDDESDEVSSRSRQRRSSGTNQYKRVKMKDLDSDDESDEVASRSRQRRSSGKNHTKWVKMEDLDSDDESEISRIRQRRSTGRSQRKKIEDLSDDAGESEKEFDTEFEENGDAYASKFQSHKQTERTQGKSMTYRGKKKLFLKAKPKMKAHANSSLMKRKNSNTILKIRNTKKKSSNKKKVQGKEMPKKKAKSAKKTVLKQSLKGRKLTNNLKEKSLSRKKPKKGGDRQPLTSSSVRPSEGSNGLEGIVPIVDMPVEIRDDQNVWSSSRIHKIHKGKTLYCTIRYDGWGVEWNVKVPWENNHDLAQIATYTKRALCYVNMSDDKTIKRFWPSVVNIRMPDPRCNAYQDAANALRAERKVFIEPYGEDLLPKYVSSKIMNGGMWIDKRHVKEWRVIKEIPSKDTISTHFRKVYYLALADKDVTNTLPKDAFERGGGSLVKKKYRVLVDDQDGCKKNASRTQRVKKIRVSKCQGLDFREEDVAASSLQFPDLKKGGEKIGDLTITKIRLSSRETQANTFLSHLLGSRIKVIDVPLSRFEQNPYETKFEQNGNAYELISVKQQSDTEVNTFGFNGQAKCARLVYAQISGNGLETVDVKDWLCRLADFSSLTPRKLVARLELLQSPCYKFSSGEYAIIPIPKREFKDIKEEGQVGCGFICDDLLEQVMGSGDVASRTICLQVRIYIPTMGIYKGMLMRKRIDSGPRILLPSSMKKVEASKHPKRDESATLVITQAGVDQSKNNVYMGRLPSLDKNADKPPASFQPKRLSSMITRLFEALGASKEMVKEYAFETGRYEFESKEPDRINHAYVRGVIDPTGQLPSGHVFLTGVRNEGVLGDKLFVTRSPCIQVNDARMLSVITEKPECMDDDSWESLQDLPFGAIIFALPQEGDKSLPECIANGDLDGDRYFCCWNKDILACLKAVPISDEEMLADEEEPKKKESTTSEPSSDWWSKAQQRMSDIIAMQDLGNLISKLYTLSGKCADENEQEFMKDPDAQHFAKAFVYALENGKHGTKIELPLHLHERLPESLRSYLAVPSS